VDGSQPSPNAAGATFFIDDDPKTANAFVSLAVLGGGVNGNDPAPVCWKVKRGMKIRGTGQNFCNNGGPAMTILLGFGLRYDD
jgi:hypothetical protein